MNKQGTIPIGQAEKRYTAIHSSLNTFDVINCEHKDWFWRLIGHTAMVYRDVDTGQIMVYESTSLNKFSGISGVQLAPMRIWIRYYPGKVFVRRMMYKGKPLPYITDDYKFHPTLSDHIREHRGVPYPDLSDPKQALFLAYSAIDLPFGIGQNPDRHDIIFCTQLVVDAFQTCGLYTGDEVPAEFEPDDTRPGGKFEDMLTEGMELGNEIRIK